MGMTVLMFYLVPYQSSSLWSVDRAVQFCAGGTAGLFVDVIVYPVDTLKTRLQSSSGSIFTPCGRLRLFAGLPTVLLGSGPSCKCFRRLFLHKTRRISPNQIELKRLYFIC